MADIGGGGAPQAGPPPGPGAAAPQGPGWYQAADGLWYPPVQQMVVEKKSNTGLIIGIVIAVVLLVCLVPTVAIVAITFLGRAASEKFSSVGSQVTGFLPPPGTWTTVTGSWR